MRIPHLVLVLVPSLTWAGFWVAMKVAFRCTEQKTTEKTLLILSGYFCAVLQLVIVAISKNPIGLMGWIGLAGYLLANLLFWLALSAHGKTRPAFAFVPTAPSSFTYTGPYRFVRHPIYTAYLLAWLAGPLLTGNLWLLATFGWMWFLYYRAAAQEENIFSTSSYAFEYKEYKKQTGMFLPRIV